MPCHIDEEILRRIAFCLLTGAAPDEAVGGVGSAMMADLVEAPASVLSREERSGQLNEWLISVLQVIQCKAKEL